MRKMFYMFIWYLFVICKFFALIWHHLLPKNKKIGVCLTKKAENFLFFSPRVYKVKRMKPELKKVCKAVRLFTKDLVKIHASYIPPEGDNPVVLYFHGQSENITKWQDTFLFLKNIGCGALFLSYRGHYKSAGRPSEEGLYTDAETAMEYLFSQGFSPDRIILWGRSLGSAPAIQTALKYDVKAIILESPIENIRSAALSVFARYTKIFKIIILKRFIKWLIQSADFIQEFANDEKIKDVRCPILIMHSINDAKIYYEQALSLSQKNEAAKLILEENGSHDKSDWCFPHVTEFMESLN